MFLSQMSYIAYDKATFRFSYVNTLASVLAGGAIIWCAMAITRREPLLELLAALAFSFFSMLAFSKTTFVFDATRGTVSGRRWTIAGKKEYEFALRDVRGVLIEEHDTKTWVLTLKTNRCEIPLYTMPIACESVVQQAKELERWLRQRGCYLDTFSFVAPGRKTSRARA